MRRRRGRGTITRMEKEAVTGRVRGRGLGLARWRWAVLAAAAPLAWLHYRGTLAWVAANVTGSAGDMAHAYAVPLIAAARVWRRRGELRAAAGRPSLRGLGWVVFFAALAWFGASGGHERVSQVSLIGLVWSVPYALWGEGVGRLALFPAWLFLFTVPPVSRLGGAALFLRALAAAAAARILNGLGVDAMRSGTGIFSLTPGHEFGFDIVAECSGLRSVLALVMLTAVCAHTMLESRPRRWLLLACSVPAAVLGNIARVVSVCLVAHGFGQEAAEGAWHAFSGYAFFLASLLVMLDLARHLRKPAAGAGNIQYPTQGAPLAHPRPKC